ncbi:MAG: hypothetical protein VXX06_07570, partial [Pseudomonadota bacterium]|nr:hypothetical protein [Pseudomonadota bacterium]
NIIIPHVRRDRLVALYEAARDAGLHGAEEGLISDMIACPGLDYCNLANARSLPLAEKIFRQFPDPARRQDESFGDHLRRVGPDPFKRAVYAGGAGGA